MFSRLKNRKSGQNSTDQSASADAVPVACDGPTYVIGDVHGRADLLPELFEKLEQDLQTRNAQGPQIVFVGDIVDRGEDSASALATVKELTEQHEGRISCLLGNHELMMLEFLDTPETGGARWIRNGGLQTLASYRIGGVSAQSSTADIVDASSALKQEMGDELIDWVRNLPLFVQSGNLICVHAAIDPALPLEAQDPKTLIWGNGRFLTDTRDDGVWIAHGHTIVDNPVASDGRISVDTGAYYTGVLTAAAIHPGEPVTFLQTGRD